MWTETPFGWLERTGGGTHPVSAITTTAAPATAPAHAIALGGLGLHEVERSADGALLLTLFRAVGWMSRGDLSTRPGHAGYNVQTPDAQGVGHLRFRYALAVGPDAVRELEPALVGAARARRSRTPSRSIARFSPSSRRRCVSRSSSAPTTATPSSCALVGPPNRAVTARVRCSRPLARAWASDLDERVGAELALGDARDELAVAIPANDVVTVRFC